MIPLQRIFHQDGNQDRISYQSMEAEELAREDAPEPSVNLNPTQANTLRYTKLYTTALALYQFCSTFCFMGNKT